jgi:HAD superfamily hydrolase (TIGR01490 family)
MALALFDLDNTLLSGDSDYLWGQFLAEHQLVDAEFYESENERFYRQYLAGSLDIYEFLDFQLSPLAAYPRSDLERWRDRFLAEKIEPVLLPAARDLVESHRRRGDLLAVITATNRFITEPIAARFGITELLATEPESADGQFTGRVAGTPCFQEGKVTRLKEWLRRNGQALTGSTFYSDSHNDLPLLSLVDHPVAVDPDDKLRAEAVRRNWLVISLRS